MKSVGGNLMFLRFTKLVGKSLTKATAYGNKRDKLKFLYLCVSFMSLANLLQGLCAGEG